MSSKPIELPAVLRDPKFRFIKLGRDGEWLKRPIEPGWNIFDLEELKAYIHDKMKKWDKDDSSGKHKEMEAKGQRIPKRPVFKGRQNNYSHDDPEFQDWLAGGGNYGVIGAGGLLKLESDDIARWEKLGILAMLPETFAVQSSTSNRQHFYFYYPKESDCPLYDPETGVDIGHIRGTGDEAGRGGMVVGPGSLHPSGVRYTVVRNVPIAHLSREVLEKIKEILRKPNGSKNCECNNETSAEKANVITIRETDPFSNVTCTQVLGSDWSWHNEGSQKAGPNPYGIHSNKTGHNLVVTRMISNFTVLPANKEGEYPG